MTEKKNRKTPTRKESDQRVPAKRTRSRPAADLRSTLAGEQGPVETPASDAAILEPERGADQPAASPARAVRRTRPRRATKPAITQATEPEPAEVPEAPSAPPVRKVWAERARKVAAKLPPPREPEPADLAAGPAGPMPAGPTRRVLDLAQLLAFEAAMRDPKVDERPFASPPPELEPDREPASSATARAPSTDFERLRRQAEPTPEPAGSAITGAPSGDLDRLTGQDERWLLAGDLASLAVIGALVFLNIANLGGPWRVLLALAFVTFVPGWALARAAGLAGGLSGLAVAMLSSLTICAAASTLMVWLNLWHPLVLLAGIGALSAVLLLWTLPAALVGARLRG